MTTTASPTDPAHPGTGHHHDRPPRWHHARVAWFDTTKGFGFLTPTSGPAVFVDFSVVDTPGYRTLTAGQPVVYTVTATSRGPEATRVIPCPRPIAGRIAHSGDGLRSGRRYSARAARHPGNRP
ncbi:cold-shock protein [Nocardia sp. NPDC001965]